MRSKQLIYLFVVAAGGAAAAGALVAKSLSSRATSPPPPPPKLPILTVDPSVLENGELWATSDQTIRLPIRNNTGKELHVVELRFNCACTAAATGSFTLAPGEVRDVDVRVNALPKEPWQVGQSAWLLDFTMQPVVRGMQIKQVWRIRRVIKSPIVTSLPAVMFGESNRVGRAPVPRTVRLHLQVPGTPHVEANVPEVTVRLISSEQAGMWELIVIPNTNHAAGPFSGCIRISVPAVENGSPSYSLDLPVDGTLLGE